MSGASSLLQRAQAAMLARGFWPEFAPEALAELGHLLTEQPAPAAEDLRGLLWSSIDNDDSLDLDQIEVAEDGGDGTVRLKVAIADVDGSVRQGGALDAHAAHNTTSVYAGVTVFTMLPQPLSYEATSLKQDVDRPALVVSFRVHPDGTLDQETVGRAVVRNKAKLAYSGLADWLSGKASVPGRVQALPGLQAQLQLQNRATLALRARRAAQGALDLDTLEARPVLANGEVVDLVLQPDSRSRQLIEDLMVASNGVMARFLSAKKRSSIARVVKVPKRWERIVALAKGLGTTLPSTPDPAPLERFLLQQKASDPVHFPDLSLAVVKLLGPGEYDLQPAGAPRLGHFGLAVQDYTHSTAPNRRFADLVTQRLVKAALDDRATPYPDAELQAVARRCTQMEDGARHVERLVRKMAAAELLRGRVGQTFDGVVTGVTDQGTFARLLQPPAEGRVVRGERGLDVGDLVRLKLLATDPARGFIDLARA